MGSTGNTIQAEVVAQIKAEMAAGGLNQTALAETSGIPTSTLSRYLNGTRDLPLPAVIEIAAALGVSFPELLVRAQQRAGVTP